MWIYLVAISAIISLNWAQLPPEIDRCPAGDRICIANLITLILHSYPKGLPEIGLDAINSIDFDNVIVSDNELNLRFETLNIQGFENTTIRQAKGFEKDLPVVFELSGWTPLLSLQGLYEIHGKLLQLPIQGHGQAQVQLKDCQFRCKARGIQDNDRGDTNNDGKTYLKILKVKCLVDINGLHLNFENLYNNKELSDSMNEMANKNWQRIWLTMRKGINSAVDQVAETLLKRVTSKLPYNEFYTDGK